MAGQGGKGTVGGVAFGSNTAFYGLMLTMKPSPWICNVLWPFDSPYYVQIMTKTSLGKHGESEWQWSKQPGVLEMSNFDGNPRIGWWTQTGRFSWAAKDMFGSSNTHQEMQIPPRNGPCFILEACRSFAPLFLLEDGSVISLLIGVDTVFWFLD